MKITDPTKAIMSGRFRHRARHYRLAAAVAPPEVEMFRNLAMTFDRLLEHFAQAETGSRSL